MVAPDRRLLTAPGGEVSLTRDQWGIPDLAASSTADAWWALGHVAATDRLWQLEYDRRRATGRWSEVVGPTGIPTDVQGRRLDLVRTAQADVAVMNAPTSAAFTAYAAGVNAGARAAPLPVVRCGGDRLRTVGAVAQCGRVQDQARADG